jgi:hypothetical protein
LGKKKAREWIIYEKGQKYSIYKLVSEGQEKPIAFYKIVEIEDGVGTCYVFRCSHVKKRVKVVCPQLEQLNAFLAENRLPMLACQEKAYKIRW